jgi:hypothetical protein
MRITTHELLPVSLANGLIEGPERRIPAGSLITITEQVKKRKQKMGHAQPFFVCEHHSYKERMNVTPPILKESFNNKSRCLRDFHRMAANPPESSCRYSVFFSAAAAFAAVFFI